MNDVFNLLGNCHDGDVLRWLENPKNMLLAELMHAHMLAKRGGKSKTYDTHSFEVNLIENLISLRDAMWDGVYQPMRGTAHIVTKPVLREIFAAPYRDRVAHHWIVMNILEWWDRRFIEDSYSCRKEKGTLYGVKRLNHHILSASDCYREPVVAIKMDISGYFMHIQRDLLYARVKWGLDQMFPDHSAKRYKILKDVIKAVIFDNPVDGVKIQGRLSDWKDLPDNKSLFMQPPGQGIVIGNLTSQVFSNIYLDILDRFIRYDLGYKHYGRYVDDFVRVVPLKDKERALEDTHAIEILLQSLGLSLNKKKTQVLTVEQGVPFLGMIVKKGRIVPGKRTLKNFRAASFEVASGQKDIDTIVSYLGLMMHCKGGMVTKKIFDGVGWDYNL